MKILTLMPDDIKITAREGQTLLSALGAAGLDVDGSCGGRGVCGKCLATVEETGVSGAAGGPAAGRGSAAAPGAPGGRREVLACQYEITSDLKVWLKNKNDRGGRKADVSLPPGFAADPALQAACRAARRPLGVAVDLGTTTIVAMLWDVVEAELLGAKGINNPQGAYGADVISRINFTMQAPENLKILQGLAVAGINEAVSSLLAASGRREDEIGRFAVVGNTTMSHIFSGTDPRSLAVLPFAPVFTAGREFRAEELGLRPAGARVVLLPNVAGHVGSDITAGMLACGFVGGGQMDEEKAGPAGADEKNGRAGADAAAGGAGPALYIDVGTNGEIALRDGRSLLVCSTAAGPAFEGSRISCGMRAGTGAIEGARMTENGLKLNVIGEEEGAAPVGICGSGIIDLVSELLNAGLLSSKGKLLSAGGEKFFTVWSGEETGGEIRLTQKDVREVQLAKGAIAAGAKILLQKRGLSAADLEAVYIAGAFGSHINLQNAVNIGLLPRVEKTKLVSAGNAAGQGASMALLSDEFIGKAEEIRRTAAHMELSTQPDFLQIYAECMNFDQ